MLLRIPHTSLYPYTKIVQSEHCKINTVFWLIVFFCWSAKQIVLESFITVRPGHYSKINNMLECRVVELVAVYIYMYSKCVCILIRLTGTVIYMIGTFIPCEYYYLLMTRTDICCSYLIISFHCKRKDSGMVI